MPAFVLHGSPTSTNTARVRLTLAEGSFTDYELVLFNLHKGEQKVSRRSLVQIMLLPKFEKDTWCGSPEIPAESSDHQLLDMKTSTLTQQSLVRRA
jgi:hypothetical protein